MTWSSTSLWFRPRPPTSRLVRTSNLDSSGSRRGTTKLICNRWCWRLTYWKAPWAICLGVTRTCQRRAQRWLRSRWAISRMRIKVRKMPWVAPTSRLQRIISTRTRTMCRNSQNCRARSRPCKQKLMPSWRNILRMATKKRYTSGKRQTTINLAQLGVNMETLACS